MRKFTITRDVNNMEGERCFDDLLWRWCRYKMMDFLHESKATLLYLTMNYRDRQCLAIHLIRMCMTMLPTLELQSCFAVKCLEKKFFRHRPHFRPFSHNGKTPLVLLKTKGKNSFSDNTRKCIFYQI